MAKDIETTKVAFFIDRKRTYIPSGCGQTPGYAPREVTAVFVDTGNFRMKECYAHCGQHGTCGVDWVADSMRPATKKEYQELFDELENCVGYNLEVIDAAWWIEKASARLAQIEDYYCGERHTVA